MEDPKNYKGIEYVRLQELPGDQQDILKASLNQDLYVNILVNGKLFQDCILYKDYRNWFEQVYSKAIIEKTTPVKIQSGGLLKPIPLQKFETGGI